MIKNFSPHLIGPIVIIIGVFIYTHESEVLNRLEKSAGIFLESQVYNSSNSGVRSNYSPMVKCEYVVNDIF